jgi:DNA-binding transcriptional regulator GbsR (MarR family)
LSTKVDGITISGDVSSISERVGKLEAVKDDYKAADTKLKEELQKDISDLSGTLTTAYTKADEKVKEDLQVSIDNAKTELNARIDAQGESISGLSSSVQGNVREVATIKAQLADTIVPDLNTKVSSSTFQSEVGRLDGRIDKANENITLIKNDLNGEGNANSLQAQINTNKEDIQKAYQYTDDELKEATDAINSAIGTVDVEKDGSLATQISTNSEQIKNISDNLGDLDSILGTSPKKSLSERLGNLSTLDDSVAVKLSNSIQEISRVDNEVTAIKNSTSYIKNNGDEVKGYIQEIVFLRTMDEYNALGEKGKYTLYLIQEEGE